MITYRVSTLGCKANLYDSRRLAEALEAAGLHQAAEGAAADVCVLNTCAVTSVADRKSRQMAARLVRESPTARVFVTGCGATAAPGPLRAVAGISGVFGRDEWPALLAAIAGPAGAQAAQALAGDSGIRSFDGRARAFLKAQEGCDSFCSYCILPHVRGRPRSRALADVRVEAERLAAAGFAEIVLTGIHLGLYGRDLPGRPSLAEAVLAVAEARGVERVRLSSIEADEVDDGLLEAMAHSAVCPHLYMPLQSGDDGVLAAMNRHYTAARFLDVVARARDRLDRPAVTTDVMVGFPGETDGAFERTLGVVEQAAFSRLHVFPFSPRPGTAAAAMPGRVSAREVRARSRRLRELGAQLAAAWAQGFVGASERVLFEREGRVPGQCGLVTGYTDRYVLLTAPGGADLIGHTARVLCTARKGATLLGRVEAEECGANAPCRNR